MIKLLYKFEDKHSSIPNHVIINILIFFSSSYLISRFLFMIVQTRELPMISTRARVKRTVVRATPPDSDMTKGRQCIVTLPV